MPSALYASPFSKLNLSHDDRKQLQATATTLVNKAQAKYERFLWDDHSSIDAAQWTPLKSKEDVRVYHDRRPGAGTGIKDMHLLLTVGTVVGTLNDALYGTLNHTTDAMRIKTAYVQDTLLDSAVLETLVEPTLDEPFQSMSVRWFVNGVPLHARLLTKHGDTVYLEATGTRQLRNGERVGFHLMHSVSFPTTPKLLLFQRNNFSMCALWRQRSRTRVEAFMTTSMEIPESRLVPLMVRSLADASASLWKVVVCAERKKLAYLVTHKDQYMGNANVRGRASTLGDGCCGVCGDHSHARSAWRGTTSACAICAQAACRKCRVKRELAFLSDAKLLTHKMRFCLPCLTATHRLDAAAIAAAEVSSSRRPKELTRSRSHTGSSLYRSSVESTTD